MFPSPAILHVKHADLIQMPASVALLDIHWLIRSLINAFLFELIAINLYYQRLF